MSVKDRFRRRSICGVRRKGEEASHMSNNRMITISREFGSGGHDIGEALAQKLGLPFYDNELINIAAKDSGYSEEMFHEAEKAATNTFSFALNVMGSGGNYGVPLNNQLHMIQSSIIRSIADSQSAVIVGSCSDYVLRDYAECINIFIGASLEARIDRVAMREHVLPASARSAILRMDKCRSTYYNFYTSQKWGERKNYDLCLNSTKLSVDEAAELLARYVRAVWGEA